jgi:hypothetical protein
MTLATATPLAAGHGRSRQSGHPAERGVGDSRRLAAEETGDYGQLARRRLMAGALMSAGDYVHALR